MKRQQIDPKLLAAQQAYAAEGVVRVELNTQKPTKTGDKSSEGPNRSKTLLQQPKEIYMSIENGTSNHEFVAPIAPKSEAKPSSFKLQARPRLTQLADDAQRATVYGVFAVGVVAASIALNHAMKPGLKK